MPLQRNASATFRWGLVLAIIVAESRDSSLHADGSQVAGSGTSEITSDAPGGSSSDVTASMEHLEPLWESMRSDVISTEAKFRIFFNVIPAKSLSSTDFQEILARSNLSQDHSQVLPFLQEVAGADPVPVPPDRHILEQGSNRRYDMNPMSYLHEDGLSVIVDGGNKQIRLFDPGRTPSDGPNLGVFRIPPTSRASGYLPGRAERDGNSVRLTSETTPDGLPGKLTTVNTIDWATGIPIRRVNSINDAPIQDVQYFGLTTFAGGITFPRCALTVRYAADRVGSIDLAVLDEARFNEPIAAAAFIVAKPENWELLDFRNQAEGLPIPVPPEEVTDVRSLIPSTLNGFALVAAQSERNDAPQSLTKRVLLILNGLGLNVLGRWLWKRASLKESKR